MPYAYLLGVHTCGHFISKLLLLLSLGVCNAVEARGGGGRSSKIGFPTDCGWLQVLSADESVNPIALDPRRQFIERGCMSEMTHILWCVSV